MSTYLVSDIHGCDETFKNTLKSIELKKSDSLIILGDIIDRGTNSKSVLDTIFLLLKNGFNVTCLKGNHEQMLIDSLENFSMKMNWLRNGGNETLSSFLTSDIHKIPPQYIDFLKSLKSYLLIDNYILVHAGINMKLDKPFEDENSLLWLRKWKDVYDEEWLGNRVIIHGHTPMTRKEIINQFKEKQKVICIDNGSYLQKEGYGGICVLRLEDLSLHFEKKTS